MLKATYRLQFSKDFTFEQARALVERYFKLLGVSHLYVSPALESVALSNHGYDVINPHQISSERGGEAQFLSLAQTGSENSVDLVLDIVPNHEFLGDQNERWRDPAKRAELFDILPGGSARRFYYFDLAGLRVDEPAVFQDTHSLIIHLVKEGHVKGLRLDYINGLSDPDAYLSLLKSATGLDLIWVEKILAPGETLAWQVKGTVGYEFLRASQEVFMNPGAEDTLTAFYQEFSGEKRSFRQVVTAARAESVAGTYSSETGVLSAMMPSVPRADIEAGLIALEARTFVVPGKPVSAADRRAIESAGLPENIRRILLLEETAEPKFVTYFQQLADFVGGTAYLKAYYRHHRLICQNEMGVDASRWSASVSEFHAHNRSQLEHFPEGLLSRQTHDTFLSSDSRARIVALTFMPDEWRARVLAWQEANQDLTPGQNGDGSPAPDANCQYRLYQALTASWPISLERFLAYVQKSNREAGIMTSWASPNVEWEKQVENFARGLFASKKFLDDFEPFASKVQETARFIAVGQLLLQLTSPGVPDIFWGDELEVLSLIDPDQRRPVDWEKRLEVATRLAGGGTPQPEDWKMQTILQALALRARHQAAFLSAYEPIEAGDKAVCFSRGDSVRVEVPLVPGTKKQGPPPGWSDLLAGLPVGLYEKDGNQPGEPSGGAPAA